METKTASSLFWLSLVTAILAMLRYVGWIMILAEILLIFIVYRSSLKKAIISSVIFGGMAALPFILWVVGRNYLGYHTFFGARDTGLVSVLGNIVVTFAKVNYWFFPLSLTQRLPPLWIWIGSLVILISFNRKNDWTRWVKKWVSDEILPLTISSVLYYLFIILTIYTRDHLITDYYDDRLQAPLFFVVIIGIFIGVDELILVHIQSSRRKLADVIITIIFVSWALYPINLIYKFIHTSLQEGVVAYNNYNTKALNESGLVEFLRSFDFDESLKIYTNYGEAVYLYTGLNTRPSPRDLQSYTADPTHLASQFESWPPEPQAYLIWFRSSEKRKFFTPRDLSQISSMELLYNGSRGQVYLVTPK